MYKHLPSLPALRVFEAAGRHESFTLAADELHVTTSAVSRQIRALEDELGHKLFTRLPRGLELTREGAAYLAEVGDALRRLEQASASLRAGDRRRVLRLSVIPSFAGNWLVPRLPAFEQAHPGIDVVMEATIRYADFDGSHGPYPITVDGSGDPAGLRLAIDSTDLEGVCTSPTYYPRHETPVPLGRMYGKGIRFHTGRCHARGEIPAVADATANGRLHPEVIATRRVAWHDAAQAMAEPEVKLVVDREAI